MNKLFLSALLILSVSGYAQTWSYVGPEGGLGTSQLSLALDAGGTPYVAYTDPSNNYKATVKQYNGSSWVAVGTPGFTDSATGYVTLALSAGGTPFVIFSDAAASNKASVMKFNGSSWVTVGPAGFSDAEVYNTNIAIDGSGTPYVAYYDTSLHYTTVKKYDGTNWVSVGSLHIYYQGTGILAIDRSGVPYVAADSSGGVGLTVKKYDGTNWVAVGSPSFTPSAAYFPTLAIDSSGKPYVCYQDEAHGGFVSVMEYNGTNWVNVGAAGFSTGEVGYFVSMGLDKSGKPYVAYMDASNSFKATAMKYTGSSWEVIGSAGFSNGQGDFTTIAVDGNGTAYVALVDSAGGDVMRLESTVGVKNMNSNAMAALSVFPNPNQGAFTLGIPVPAAGTAQGEDILIIVTNIIGEKVAEFKTAANQNIEVLLNASPGVYFITAVSANGKQSAKVIVER